MAGPAETTKDPQSMSDSRMLRPDTSTSNNSFFARLSIDQLTASLDLTLEVRVVNGLLRDQIHVPAEETLELIREREVSVRVGASRPSVRHLDDEIEIA